MFAMTSKLHHEQIYRGKAAMEKIADTPLHICGAGALGSNVAVNLARLGWRALTVIDKDRVEEHNVGTQVYSVEDVGAKKVDMLRNLIYREVGEEIVVHGDELTGRNIGKLLRNAQLVLDTFDNSASRAMLKEYCASNGVHCLHAGVNDGYGEVIWNEKYLVPNDEGLDVCDYPLSRNLILLVVSVASEVLVRFAVAGAKEEYSITVGDLQINREIDR
jgi:molybdopterin/thiamine biosynthesis adenylyltransferase